VLKWPKTPVFHLNIAVSHLDYGTLVTQKGGKDVAAAAAAAVRVHSGPQVMDDGGDGSTQVLHVLVSS
jgi:hypothetical protein